jgi:hypothetical protein
LQEEFRKFPDEDKIEEILDRLYTLAWEKGQVDKRSLETFKDGFNWVLGIWNKTLGSKILSEIVSKGYLDEVHSEHDRSTLQKLDLVICFYHHYIYAFDEFMNRKFRHSVIRCGLICERIVKRLAAATNNFEIMQIPKFEDRSNKLKSLLEGKCSEIDHLTGQLQYIYHQRTRTGAHDFRAATALIAKSCITEAPTIYMLYLNALVELGFDIYERENLLELVNSTISTGTTLIVAKEGKSVKAEQVIESLYKQSYFVTERSMSDIQEKLRNLTYSFPTSTLFKALSKLSGRSQILLKKRKSYVQRLPPNEYYGKEIVA